MNEKTNKQIVTNWIKPSRSNEKPVNFNKIKVKDGNTKK